MQLRSAQMRKVFVSLLFTALLLAIGGCSNSGEKAKGWEGPQVPAPLQFEPWKYHDTPGRTVKTPHYAIHTTIDDTELLGRIAQVMEGGLQQYQRLAPGVPLSDRPMECFIFAERNQWVQFTRENTGMDAVQYLKISRGAYTVRDWYVSYLLSDESTFGTAAHEGWHQYASRCFKGQLPAFLEEGIATQFENIHWEGKLPRWNLAINASRAQRLRAASDGKYLWPLEKLVTMHAGDVFGLSNERIEAFYAQDWAFARFLWEGENGRYRQGFQRLLSDTAHGIAWDADPNATRPSPVRLLRMGGKYPAYMREEVKPTLEHYLGTDLATLETQYRAYIQQVAFDRFNEQWQPRS
jgi:hypothetical protein